MDQMRNRAIRIFFQRIVWGINIIQFDGFGNDLLPDRIPFTFNRGQHCRGNSHWIGPDDGFHLLGIDPKILG